MNCQKGFTIVELIVYMSLTVLTLAALLSVNNEIYKITKQAQSFSSTVDIAEKTRALAQKKLDCSKTFSSIFKQLTPDQFSYDASTSGKTVSFSQLIDNVGGAVFLKIGDVYAPFSVANILATSTTQSGGLLALQTSGTTTSYLVQIQADLLHQSTNQHYYVNLFTIIADLDQSGQVNCSQSDSSLNTLMRHCQNLLGGTYSFGTNGSNCAFSGNSIFKLTGQGGML